MGANTHTVDTTWNRTLRSAQRLGRRFLQGFEFRRSIEGMSRVDRDCAAWLARDALPHRAALRTWLVLTAEVLNKVSNDSLFVLPRRPDA